MTRRLPMKRSHRHPDKATGFTLVELMVLLAVLGVCMIIAVSVYKQGMYREYKISQEARSVSNVLHAVQWKALQNKNSFIISTGTSTDPVAGAGAWYATVTFVTPTNHNFQTGDIAIFANLNAHVGMNVGRYYVTKLDALSFKCNYYTQVSAATHDLDPGSGSTARPVVMNMRTASQVIIVKQAYVDSLSGTTVPKKDDVVKDPQYFIYQDGQMTMWDTTGSPALGTVQDPNYMLVLAFDARGFPTSLSGYTLAIGKSPPDLKVRKLITVSPTGRIGPGS